MRYCFDIDGVIADSQGTDYHGARPMTATIQRINRLYDEGHTIVLHTARGMGTLDGDLERVHATWYDFTVDQMKGWGLRFHELFLGKPYADVYVDDKGVGFDLWMASAPAGDDG